MGTRSALDAGGDHDVIVPTSRPGREVQSMLREPHWRSTSGGTDRAGAGRHGVSRNVRGLLTACPTTLMTSSSARFGVVASTSALSTCAARSAVCIRSSLPLRRPPAVRAAATYILLACKISQVMFSFRQSARIVAPRRPHRRRNRRFWRRPLRPYAQPCRALGILHRWPSEAVIDPEARISRKMARPRSRPHAARARICTDGRPRAIRPPSTALAHVARAGPCLPGRDQAQAI